jgi:glycosyltransferase involved in cell wall biosynthesis
MWLLSGCAPCTEAGRGADVNRVAWLSAGDESGGIARSLVAVHEALRSQGDVVALVSIVSGDLVSLARGVGIAAEVCGPRSQLVDGVFTTLSARMTTVGAGVLSLSSRLVSAVAEASRRAFDGRDPSVIHVRSPHLVLLGGAVARRLDVPIVWQIPNFIGGRPGRRPVREGFYRSIVARAGARPLANSQAVAAEFSFLGDVPWAYVPLESRYFDRAAHPRPLDELTFLSIGRIHPLKGQLQIVSGFEHYCASGGVGELHIIGLLADDAASDALRARVAASPDRGRIALQPFQEDPVDTFVRASVVISGQTVMEPFGQVAAQAISLGIPVLALGRGGPAELVARTGFGWTAADFTPERIALGLHTAAATVGQMRSNAAEARGFAREAFGPEAFQRVYTALLDDSR